MNLVEDNPGGSSEPWLSRTVHQGPAEAPAEALVFVIVSKLLAASQKRLRGARDAFAIAFREVWCSAGLENADQGL